MRLTVNGEVRQDWSTDDMIYNIYEQIAYLTQVMTLMPGDIPATGTPAGFEDKSRPAPQCVAAELDGSSLVQCDLMAMLDDEEGAA